MEPEYYNINLEYCRASSGQRMANYLIDLLVFYIIIFFWGAAIEILSPGSLSEMDEVNPLLDRVVSILFYGIVMFGIETAFQGRTLGKLITGTKAIDRDGGTPSFKQLLIRNFTRAVPFNALSAFGSPCTPWHDTWSDTLVVDVKKLDLELRKDEFYDNLRDQNMNP